MSTGNQFALIPWRAQIRSGGLRAWPDAAVAVLPVLAVHESPLLEAWPSQTRIASLAGVSKTTLGAGLRFLVEQGWMRLTKRKTFRAWHTVYRLEYLHYRKGSPGAASLFLALPYALILSGVWGKMSGATKRLYLVMRAHCVASDGADWTDNPAAACGSFLPAKKIQPGEFAELAGIHPGAARKIRGRLEGAHLLTMGPEGWFLSFEEGQARHSVPRTAPLSTASLEKSAEARHTVPSEEGNAPLCTESAPYSTTSAPLSTESAPLSTVTITSIKEEIRENSGNMKREPLILPGTPQTGVHGRNTPTARCGTGERNEKATVREGSGESRDTGFEADLAMLAAVQARLKGRDARQG